ncbi:MAG: lipid-A-disaccharide synthase N-terminal domain-containing protein [Planctomycetes bacterium]|nr:lipid-A-disaccharide synthase N-terminal domain-containing protein [Planctomycetota bacterium]
MNPLLVIAQNAAQRAEWWPDSWFGRSWVLFGFAAQAVFTARFLVQWIASEKRGKSHVPVAFWYLSLVGAAMLFTYAAFWKHDPVVSVGQATGGFIYVRNLMLLQKERRRSADKQ